MLLRVWVLHPPEAAAVPAQAFLPSRENNLSSLHTQHPKLSRSHRTQRPPRLFRIRHQFSKTNSTWGVAGTFQEDMELLHL